MIQVVSRRACKVEHFPDFEAMKAAGYLPTGKVGGDHLRDELRGQPVFAGLYGPMWGGASSPIRYEDSSSYEALSA